MHPIPELPSCLQIRAHAERGLYFEDLNVGDRFDTREMQLDERSVVEFARHWDPQPFHMDREAAAKSLFGGLSASGLQAVLLSYRLYVEMGLFDGTALAGLGIDNIRFKAPLRPGDRIRVQAVIAAARRSSRPGRAVVRVTLHTHTQTGEETTSMDLNFLLAARA